MPLSSKGESILRKFVKLYGRKTGRSYFYAKENKSPKFAAAVKR